MNAPASNELYLSADNTLAQRFGWTDVFLAGDSLIGTPPTGGHSSRGQALVPRWTQEWRELGPLMVRHNVQWFESADKTRIYSGRQGEAVLGEVFISDHPSKEAAVRFAVCMAVIVITEPQHG